MPYSLFYRRRPYRMISYGVSPWSELARWTMDRFGIEYREESHVPMLKILLINFKDVFPALRVPEKLLANYREILDYWQARVPREEALISDRDAADVNALIDRFYWTTGMAVRRWAYYYMLDDRKGTLRCWHRGAPMWERIFSRIFFPVMRAIMRKSLGHTPTAPQECMVDIDEGFRFVDERLSDGRRYLTGDRLTAADITFAALMGPALLPEVGYAGPLPTVAEVPPAMREQVLRLRQTAAGQFALRLYREDRGQRTVGSIVEPRGIAAFSRRLTSVVTSCPRFLRCGFRLLRRYRPVLSLGKTTVVAMHADIVDVLKRDQEFTITEINDAHMSRVGAPFILGWDRSPRYDFEAGILKRTIQPGDLDRIRKLVADESRALLERVETEGRFDIISGLTRVVPTRVVAHYFGTPGPNEQVMMRWLRILFYDVFLNRSDLPHVRSAASNSGLKLADYLRDLIAARKADLSANRDDFLTRLLRLQNTGGDSLDDDGVRRDISGIIVGAVETTSAAVAQAIDVLFGRPRDFQAATEAAKAGDVGTVSKIIFEALRFNPQAPGVLRFCPAGATIAPGTKRETRVAAGSTVLLGTLSAMFDSNVFPDPGAIRLDRDPNAYLHFGHGMHTCFGAYINMVQIPEIAMAILRLDGLRRAGRMVYDGPFPDRLVVKFQKQESEKAGSDLLDQTRRDAALPIRSNSRRATSIVKQGALTVILPVSPANKPQLQTLLTSMTHAVTKNPTLKFQNSPSTHFARFVLLDGDSRLFFSTCYDGDDESYFSELHERLGTGLQQVLSHCEKCPTSTTWSRTELKSYLTANSYKSQFFYVGFPGRSAREIIQNSTIRSAVNRMLDGLSTALGSPSQQMPLKVPTQMKPITKPPQLKLRWFEKLIEWAVGIRKPAATSPNVTVHSQQLVIEDIVAQNQMTVIVNIKDSFWSRNLLRLVLWAGSAAAKNSKGALSGISTIHFARWVIIDDGTKLLFESNYDGSWERYIDDFIDKASVGLNAIWGNCPEFPLGGARDIEAFKQSIRANQVPSQFFYSAYPETTVVNIVNDARVAKAVGKRDATQLAAIASGELSYPV